MGVKCVFGFACDGHGGLVLSYNILMTRDVWAIPTLLGGQFPETSVSESI